MFHSEDMSAGRFSGLAGRSRRPKRTVGCGRITTAGTCPTPAARTDALRTPADVDDLAAHVRRVVRAEERDHACDVLRLPDLLERRLLGRVLLEVVEVDADALRRLARH